MQPLETQRDNLQLDQGKRTSPAPPPAKERQAKRAFDQISDHRRCAPNAIKQGAVNNTANVCPVIGIGPI
jgi:hypothetical protein